MKVLIVANGIPTADYPLSGIFEFDQAKALAKLGIDVDYFSIDLRSIFRKRQYGISHGVKDGVRWHTISIPIGGIPIRLFCRIGKLAILYLFRKVYTKSKKPNIIHAHFTDMGNIATVISSIYGIPLVMTEHSSAINESIIAPSLLKCAKEAYFHCDQVIAVSTPLATKIRSISGISAKVIPNIIDGQVFCNAKRISHKGFRLVTTAGLVERKRTRLILEALIQLKGSYDDIFLDVVGDGPLRQELHDIVNSNNLGGHVHFWGALKRSEMASIYSKSDCFILTSEVETFGVVYVEAMSSGLPVIATRCGGPEDFVNIQNGILIDVDNIEQLKDAIISMYNKRQNYNSEAIKLFAKHYSPENIGLQLVDLYKRTIDHD